MQQRPKQSAHRETEGLGVDLDIAICHAELDSKFVKRLRLSFGFRTLYIFFPPKNPNCFPLGFLGVFCIN